MYIDMEHFNEGGTSSIQMELKDLIIQIPMGMVFEIAGRKFVGTADNRGNNFAITELKSEPTSKCSCQRLNQLFR